MVGLTRAEAIEQLRVEGWDAVAEDVFDGLHPDAILARLFAIGERESSAAAIVASIDEEDEPPTPQDRITDLFERASHVLGALNDALIGEVGFDENVLAPYGTALGYFDQAQANYRAREDKT